MLAGAAVALVVAARPVQAEGHAGEALSLDLRTAVRVTPDTALHADRRPEVVTAVDDVHSASRGFRGGVVLLRAGRAGAGRVVVVDAGDEGHTVIGGDVLRTTTDGEGGEDREQSGEGTHF